MKRRLITFKEVRIFLMKKQKIDGEIKSGGKKKINRAREKSRLPCVGTP
jgi:hypothetical protein